MLSNYEDFDSVRSALLLGAADYLLKIKIQPDTLLACLNKTVEKLKDKVPRNWETEKKDQEEDISKLLLEFFQKDVKLSDFMGQHAKTRLAFMEDSCAVCYVPLRSFYLMKHFPSPGIFCGI